MKTTGWRSLILYIIGAGFLVGIIFFICSYFIQGGSWAIRPSNAHITNNGQLTYSGEITDRDSNLLSYSKDGVQQYNDNALIRKVACSRRPQRIYFHRSTVCISYSIVRL